MLVTDIRGHRFFLDGHDVTTRIVPLLDGMWLYHSRCRCTGRAVHGRTPRYGDARQSHRLLPCYPHTTQILVQDKLTADTSARLVGECGLDIPAVSQPYAKLSLPTPGRPSDVAVDASVRDGAMSVAAVTGRGWLKLCRETSEQPQDSTHAEAVAVGVGLELMPLNTVGTLWCDNQSVVDQIARCLRGGFSGHRPDWLPEETFDWLANLVHSRRMRIRWRPRNSTPMLKLADKFSKLGAAPEFDGAGIVRHTIWVRLDDEAAGCGFTEYCYRTATHDVLDQAK